MAVCLAFGMSAQLEVIGNGSVQVGSFADGGLSTPGPSPLGISIGTGSDINLSLSDTTATLGINGTGRNLSGGKISFGVGNVNIQEYGISSGSTFSTLMRLNSKGGFVSYCGDRQIYIYNSKGSTNPFTYKVNVSAPQYLTSSDARYKENVERLENIGDKFMELNPVTYRMKDLGAAPSDETQAEASKQSAIDDSNLRYGFIAQEVRELFPDLVYENEDGYLSIDYQGFIPILVDAVKELKGVVERQNEEIDVLKGNGQMKKSPASMEGLSECNARLYQNSPNPFNTGTIIRCEVPEKTADAMVCVYDLTGAQRLRKDIKERGHIDVRIDGNELQPGMYIYTLILDGMEFDSKRMIMTD